MRPDPDAIKRVAHALAPQLIEVRRELHQYPELSGEEFQTTARLQRWLAEAGIARLPLDLPTGVVAEVRGAKPGPTVAIRSDIDALPILEETGLPFASTVPGTMHACGHDFHMATVLGAALILQRLAPEIKGAVRILFQPSEETASGADILIQAGALDGVGAILGLHNKPDVPSGRVGVKAGPLMAAVDTLEITVTGKGGHAALPNRAIDPIVAASAVIMALQTIASRSISPLEPVVVSIATFQAGTAHNVIPMQAKLTGTVRTFHPEVRRQMPALINRLACEVAAGYGATAEVALTSGPPAVHNDPVIAHLVRQAAQRFAMEVVEAVPTTAAEDFACYQALVPGCFVWMGTGCQEEWHHPRFMVDESVIAPGAAFMAHAALEVLAALSAGEPADLRP